MKRIKSVGHSARRGNKPSPYTTKEKKPDEYSFQQKLGIVRLTSGELKTKKNDKQSNKYA